MLLSEHLSAFLERQRIERTYTKATLKSYSHRLRAFVAWLSPDGGLLATASARCGGIVFHKLRLIADPHHGVCLQPPQSIRLNDQGEREYSTLVVLPKAWRTALRDAILAAYRAQQAEDMALK